ncbi:response regulator transcription factor [uncultured Gilvimarinus sp.]|uniref:helix-turn-helix transcriptional regulator n=1 Tax=uncultured Gilvimarinus sp. TaxID=1689143 RepID=UPI0030EDC3E2|tara:strand:- start:4841 stop:5428 length:588 start_codon:yes stop_codon:yes gene_type:complete
MQSVFVSTSEINSARWNAAVADAKVCIDYSPADLPLDEPSLVWVVMSGPWQEHVRASLAAGAKVIAMTLNETAAEARTTIGLGASGYVHALAAPELLQQVKNAVEYDGIWLGKHLLSELLAPSAPAKPRPAVGEQLSMRERMVALAVARGKSNKEVARELNITERTVKAHLGRCFDKLGVRDRMQLALLINRDGI